MELGIITDNSSSSMPDVMHVNFPQILMKEDIFLTNAAQYYVSAESKDVTLQ